MHCPCSKRCSIEDINISHARGSFLKTQFIVLDFYVIIFLGW
jgi:hypothetical protein